MFDSDQNLALSIKCIYNQLNYHSCLILYIDMYINFYVYTIKYDQANELNNLPTTYLIRIGNQGHFEN